MNQPTEAHDNSEARLRNLFNAMDDVVFEMDYEGTYLTIAPTKPELMVKPSEDLTGKTLHDVFPKEQADSFLNFIRKCLNEDKSDSITYPIFIDNKEVWFEGRATPIDKNRVLYIASDITERKHAELELKKNSERLAEAQEIAGMGDFVWDLESGEVTWSLGMHKLLGYHESEVIDYAKVNAEIHHPDDLERITKWLNDCIASGKPKHEPNEYRLIRKDGRSIDVQTRLSIKYKDNKPYEVIGTCFNITEQKQTEEELKNSEARLVEAKERAEESDRLKTAFLQNISHEIRTPLNAICGFAQMLDKESLSKEQRKSHISLIQSNSDQLLSIISDVLAVSSLETGQEKIDMSTTNVNAILMELFAIFNPKANAKKVSLSLNKSLSDELSVIETDETKLRQVLTNLLTNSFKFTSKGAIEYGYSLQDDLLEFYVKDTGIGIKPKYHKAIFERFNQADTHIQAAYGGTGLGLSISMGYIEMLGGKIWLDSQPDRGSTFYFTLPYRPVNKVSNEDKEEAFKILVAEDQIINYMVLEGLLEELPVKLIHARDGQEAIDLFEENPTIKLILMDIKMPRITGDEVAKKIKSLNPDVFILAQSGYALEQEKEKYADLFDAYLTKPIVGSTLVKKVKEFIEN